MKRFVIVNSMYQNHIKNSKILLIGLLLMTIFLTGCTNSFYVRPAREKRPDPSAVKLAEAATSISHSLQQLAEIEIALHPAAILPPPPNPKRIGMDQLISVDWTGPVEPLLKRIARASHYRSRIIGIPPAIPVIVAVSAQDTLLADVLRNLQLQVEKKARIKTYPGSRVIELRYLQP